MNAGNGCSCHEDDDDDIDDDDDDDYDDYDDDAGFKACAQWRWREAVSSTPGLPFISQLLRSSHSWSASSCRLLLQELEELRLMLERKQVKMIDTMGAHFPHKCT